MTTRFTLICLSAALLLAMGACTERTSSTTSADVDAAAEKTKDSAVTAARAAADLAEKARDNTKAYFNSPEVRKDVESAKNAVKGAVDGARRGPDETPKP